MYKYARGVTPIIRIDKECKGRQAKGKSGYLGAMQDRHWRLFCGTRRCAVEALGLLGGRFDRNRAAARVSARKVLWGHWRAL